MKKDKLHWYAVQDGSFDWDSESGRAVFVRALSPQHAAELGLIAMSESYPDAGDLKVARIELEGFASFDRSENSDSYTWDEFISAKVPAMPD